MRVVFSIAVCFALSVFGACSASAAVTVSLEPLGLTFTVIQGSPNPPNQTMSLSITGGTLPWSIDTSEIPSWLTLTPTSGNSSATLTASIQIANLPAGGYHSFPTISSSGLFLYQPHIILIIYPNAPTIGLSASSLTFDAQEGAQNPVPQRLTVFNSNVAGTLKWTASASSSGGNWLNVSPASGTETGAITAYVNITGLAAGFYDGSIEVVASGATNTPQSMGVTLNLASASIIGLNSSQLSFKAQPGSNPQPQTFSISNSGGGTLSWSISVSPISGGNWLAMSPGSGTGNGTVTGTVSSASLAPGIYTAAITVAATGASNSPQRVNASLTVAPAGASVIGLTPGELQFGAKPGVNPASQVVQVTNPGAGSLGWTAAAATQSSGSWLSVSPSSGVAPSSLTVAVNPVSLPAGNYSGTVTLTAQAGANAVNSPQVLKVLLAVGGPTVGDNGVVNGASFAREAVVSPGSIASLFGIGLATDTRAATTLPLPTTLAEAQVLVNNAPAPLFFVSPNQINFQMPSGLGGITTPIAVSSAAIQGAAIQVNIAPQVPGIFSVTRGGAGQGAVLNQDFSPNGEQNPAAVGSVIQIFTTGLGATNPPLATGQPAAATSPFNATVTAPLVLIGGTSAEVLFSAMAPGFVGLYQVNARVPPGPKTGSSVPLQILMGGRSSNTVSIAVQ